jgi:hypothetical protein
MGESIKMKIFSTSSKEIKKLNFIKTNANTDGHFSGSDTKELFETNLKTQADSWIYRTCPVTYSINLEGYRTKEFKTIDWANSIVVFGCSVVFGTGVDDQHTIPAMMERQSGIPTINMWIAGSSMVSSFHNSVILNQRYPAPRAIVHLWTDYSRTVYYRKKHVEHYGVWNTTDNNYAYHWSKDDEHAKCQALFVQLAARQIWGNRTQYYEASLFSATQKLLGCDKINDRYDTARDLIHNGIKTNEKAAKQILDNLEL